MSEALHSKYIINGIPQESTPAGILSSVIDKVPEPLTAPGTIIDETLDPAPMLLTLDPSRISEYLERVLSEGDLRAVVPFAAPCTRARIAASIIEIGRAHV